MESVLRPAINQRRTINAHEKAQLPLSSLLSPDTDFGHSGFREMWWDWYRFMTVAFYCPRDFRSCADGSVSVSIGMVHTGEKQLKRVELMIGESDSSWIMIYVLQEHFFLKKICYVIFGCHLICYFNDIYNIKMKFLSLITWKRFHQTQVPRFKSSLQKQTYRKEKKNCLAYLPPTYKHGDSSTKSANNCLDGRLQKFTLQIEPSSVAWIQSTHTHSKIHNESLNIQEIWLPVSI